MTTPRTLPGKMTVIVYGLLGCSGCILFFNLFLERIITVLAVMLRSIYECRRRRKERSQGGVEADTNPRRGSRSVPWSFEPLEMLCYALYKSTIYLLTYLLTFAKKSEKERDSLTDGGEVRRERALKFQTIAEKTAKKS